MGVKAGLVRSGERAPSACAGGVVSSSWTSRGLCHLMPARLPLACACTKWSRSQRATGPHPRAARPFPLSHGLPRVGTRASDLGWTESRADWFPSRYKNSCADPAAVGNTPPRPVQPMAVCRMQEPSCHLHANQPGHGPVVASVNELSSQRRTSELPPRRGALWTGAPQPHARPCVWRSGAPDTARRTAKSQPASTQRRGR